MALEEKNKQTKQKKKTLIDTESRLIDVRGEGIWGLGEKYKGIKQYRMIVTE